LTKSELIDKVRDKTGLNKRIIKIVFDSLFDEICKTVQSDEKVDIRGFGVFKLKKIKPKKMFSHLMKLDIDVPGKQKVVFTASKNTEHIIKGV